MFRPLAEKNKFDLSIDTNLKDEVTRQIMNTQMKHCIDLLREFDDKVIPTGDPGVDRDRLRFRGQVKQKLYRGLREWKLQELSIDDCLDSLRLEDGRMIDLVRDAEHPERTRFVCWKNDEISYEQAMEVKHERYTPREITAGAFQGVRLPQKAQPYGSLPELIATLMELIQRSVWVPNESARLLAHFVIATWLTDQLSVAPYLAVVG